MGGAVAGGVGAQPPEANGGVGAKPPAARGKEVWGPLGDFYDFPTKITHFLAYLGLNFCFKHALTIAKKDRSE